VKAAEILNNTDPEELRNIVYRMRQNFEGAQLPPLTLLTTESPTQYPQMGQRDFRALDADGNLRMVMSAYDLFDELGVHAHLAGLNSSGVVQVYLSADDGQVYAGAGAVILDAQGIFIQNSTTSWFNFEDAGGNRGTINLAADPNNDLEFVNIATSPAGTISFFLKDDTGTTRRVVNMRRHPAVTDGIEIDFQGTIAGGRVGFGTDHFIDYLKSDGTGSATVYFNERNKDIDFNVQGVTDPNLLKLDAGTDRAGVGTGSPAVKLHVEYETSQANEIIDVLYIDLKSSATVENGLGPAIGYRIEDSAGNVDLAGKTGVYWVDKTSGSEDAALEIGLMKAGALTTALTLNPTSGLSINGSPLHAIVTHATHWASATVPASTTYYCMGFIDGNSGTTERAMPVLRAGTVKNLYLRTTGNQPASGSMVVTIRKNVVTDTVVTLTVAAGAAGPATFSDITHSFTVVAGDFVGVKFVNNATGASAGIGFVAFEIECDP
jgi:hypothetical protein